MDFSAVVETLYVILYIISSQIFPRALWDSVNLILCVSGEFIKTQPYAAKETFTRPHSRYGHKAEAAAHPDQVFFFSDTCRQLNTLLPVTYIRM